MSADIKLLNELKRLCEKAQDNLCGDGWEGAFNVLQAVIDYINNDPSELRKLAGEDQYDATRSL